MLGTTFFRLFVLFRRFDPSVCSMASLARLIFAFPVPMALWPIVAAVELSFMTERISILFFRASCSAVFVFELVVFMMFPSPLFGFLGAGKQTFLNLFCSGSGPKKLFLKFLKISLALCFGMADNYSTTLNLRIGLATF